MGRTLKKGKALDEYDRGVVLVSDGAKEMAARSRKAILQFTSSWADFSSVGIWTAYRRTGLQRQGKELGSAANHLWWYLRKFVPWAVKRGFLSAVALESLEDLSRLKVNPRKIRVHAVEIVGEFLAMVEGEDREGGAFLRLLAVTGLRRSGALGLKWSDVDLEAGTMVVRQKGGRDKVIPLGPEAIAVLREKTARHGKRKLWELDQNALERLAR